MDSKKPNKIMEIVRLQQILKKWKKLANASKNTTTTTTNGPHKSIKFLKKTLSFSDVSGSISAASNDVVPKGYLAVCVGKERKRFTIPTEYLSHRAFGMLLREAEEEFGFQQEGVLKIPCEVPLFENVLKIVAEKKEIGVGCRSPDCERTPTHHHHHPAQLCR